MEQQDIIFFSRSITAAKYDSDDTFHQLEVKSSSTVVEAHLGSSSQQNETRVINFGPCVVCNVNRACILFIGCNHLVCCNRCSESCGETCPLESCNCHINGRLRVFEPS
ncbi:unnamed protein product [Rotaria magnacalcarata]